MAHDMNSDPVAAEVLSRLRTVDIDQDPFPHLVLLDAFPRAFFSRLIAAMPSTSAFTPAEYPGTGRFTTRYSGQPTSAQGGEHVGLVLRDWSVAPELASLRAFFCSEGFSRVLLDRFSDPSSRLGVPAIPRSKHALFTGANARYSCVFSLHKDPVGYEISPHVDNPAKIVTFLWYIGSDVGTPSGTLLCRPKPDVDVAALDQGDYEAARKEGRTGLWMDWKLFDIVKEVGGANVLFAFAPNEISFHAVRVSGADGARERTVVRGFIASQGYNDTRLLKA